VVSSVRKYWILWFVFLAVPGSGFLRFDGIPFSSKTEFAVLAVSVVGTLLPAVRLTIRNFVQGRDGLNGQLATLIFVCAIIVKLFTFVLLPLGDGFEACYRSIYAPLTSGKCEKSFESPFLTNDLINVQGSITRMESRIDFGSLLGDFPLEKGASATSWKLPFANDYPRLDVPWLDRLPFTAIFGTLVTVKNNSVIPIVYTGEISVEVNGVFYKGSSYERRSRIFIPVTKGKNVVRFVFKFADLDSPDIPDLAPTPRGPWAHLSISEPVLQNKISLDSILDITGWTIDQAAPSSPRFVYLTTTSGELISKVAIFERPDVGNAYHDDRFSNSGFKISAALKNPESDSATYLLTTKLDADPFATISVDVTNRQVPLVSYQSNNDVGKVTEFDSVAIAFDSGSPLEPSPLVQPSPIQHSLLIFLDGLVLLSIISVTFFGLSILVKRKRELTLAAFAIATASLLARYSAITPHVFRQIPIAGCAALAVYSLIIILRNKLKYLFASAIIPILILVSRPIIEVNRIRNGMVDVPWWNFYLWYGRGSDWFVTQGYARTIFVENSLRGGEGLFYFQPGERYFVFLQHLLFGENDVLLQILVAVALLTTIIFVTRNLLSNVDDISRKIIIVLFCALGFSLFTSFNMIGFAVSQASEYPTWIATLIVIGFILGENVSVRTSIFLAVLCGLIPNFRPNQIFGACCLFLLVQLKVDLDAKRPIWLKRIWMFLVFGVVGSLSLYHNLYYAQSFTLYSASGMLNSDFRFIDLFQIATDPVFRKLVFDKLQIALWWKTAGVNSIQISFWVFQFIWLTGIIRAVSCKSKHIAIWVVLTLPLTYLIPLLPYRFDSYWPRHIVIIQLAFGLSGLVAIKNLGPFNFVRKSRRDNFVKP